MRTIESPGIGKANAFDMSSSDFVGFLFASILPIIIVSPECPGIGKSHSSPRGQIYPLWREGNEYETFHHVWLDEYIAHRPLLHLVPAFCSSDLLPLHIVQHQPFPASSLAF